MEPITLAAGLGTAVLWLAQEAGKSVVIGWSDRQVCASLKGIKDRLTGAKGLPANHDVARAVRVAQLEALDRLLRDFGELALPEWNRTLHLRPDAFLARAGAYCRDALARARRASGPQPDDQASLDLNESLVAAVDLALGEPERGGPAHARAQLIAERAENAVLAELRQALGLEVLPDGFETHVRTGTGDERKRYLELFGALVNEQLKENSRFRDIFTAAQLSSLGAVAFDTRTLVQQMSERFGGGLDRIETGIDGVRTQLRQYQTALTDVEALVRAMAGSAIWDDAQRSTSPAALLSPGVRRSTAARSGDRPAVFRVPYVVPRHFLGRVDEIAAITEALGRYGGRVAVIALIGMRGCGKSTLARAYATQCRLDYDVTWWIDAATESAIRADLSALGVALHWVQPDEREEIPVAAILERLEEDGERTLLIYDNATDAELLKTYLPRRGAAHVLITSTAPNWGAIAEGITLRLWPNSIGAQFLLARSGVGGGREAAEKLSDACGGLPLALEIAAAYCERLGISLGEYLRRFQKEGVDLIDKAGSPQEFHDRLSVTKAFQLAIGDASARHAGAEPFMVHCALLAAEPIPLFLFRDGSHHLGEPLASLIAGDALDDVVTTLRMFSLMERGEVHDERDGTPTDVVRLHRLVREIAASRWSPEVEEAARGRLITMLAHVYPSDETYVLTNWPRARRLDPLAFPLVGDQVALPRGTELAASELMFKLAAFRHSSTAAYAQARTLFERAMAIRTARLGPDHPEVARCLNSLALLAWADDDLPTARLLGERALAMREAAYGPQHADVAESLINLARILREQGEYASARHYCAQARAVVEAVHGPGHPDVALCLSTLVRVCIADGDLVAAQPLSERALAIYERTLEPHHPAIAASLANVGTVLEGLGQPARAIPHYRRALAIHEAALGPLHPTLASSLFRLAKVLWETQDGAAARLLCQRAFEIDHAVLGPDHPRTLEARAQLERMQASAGAPNP